MPRSYQDLLHIFLSFFCFLFCSSNWQSVQDELYFVADVPTSIWRIFRIYLNVARSPQCTTPLQPTGYRGWFSKNNIIPGITDLSYCRECQLGIGFWISRSQRESRLGWKPLWSPSLRSSRGRVSGLWTAALIEKLPQASRARGLIALLVYEAGFVVHCHRTYLHFP